MASEDYVNREEILPLLGVVKRSGEWLMAYCPSHGDGTKHGGHGGESLGLSDTGVLTCFAGCDFKDVILALRARDPRPQIRTPSSLPRATAEQLVKVYLYSDQDGTVIAEKARFETSDGRKTFRWRMPGDEAWKGLRGIDMKDMPLYGVALLKQKPADPVYFVEGEKACDACLNAGLVAVTHGGGASIRDFGASLDVLKGREVYLWPDNDGPGRSYMNLLGVRLSSVAKSLRVINVPLPEKGDAYDYFRAGGTVGGIESASPNEPVVHVLSQDSLQVVIPTIAGAVTLTFSEMEKTARALDSEVSIQTFQDKARPYTERTNLLSSSARTELRRELDNMYGKETGWTQVLNTAWALARDTYLRQDRGVDVFDIPDSVGDPLLVPPLVAANGPTTFFGDGSSLKSYFLFSMALSMGLGARTFAGLSVPYLPVLVVDYEDDASNFRRRLKRVAKGIEPDMDPMGVHYWPAEGIPLRDQVDAIKRKCDKEGIGLVIIDSAGPACGGAPEDAVVALSFFRALKKLGLPTIVIAHITKGGDTMKPFGSVFWHNESRRTWYVHRVQEEDSDELDIGLFCRKVNDGRKPSPMAFHASFDGSNGPIRISMESLDRVPDLLDQTNDKNRVWVSLEDRAKTVAEISRETGLTHDQVDKILRRGQFVEAGVSSTSGRGRPASLWARRSEREEEPTGRLFDTQR